MARLDVVAQLEDLAAWFEKPVAPFVTVPVGQQSYLPGMLLRQIAVRLEQHP